MPFNVFYSTDTSAPSLTNAAGSMAALLDALLVNGYGAKSPLGWSTTYTATNQRAYAQGSGSNGFKLAVDDTNVGYTSVRGYMAMTAITTGTDPFPTTAQTTSSTWFKSDSATARQWVAWGDAKRFWLAIDVFGDTTSGMVLMHFGDLFSEAATDSYATSLHSLTTTTVTVAGTNGSWYKDVIPTVAPFSGIVAHYVPRTQAGAGTSVGHSIGTNGYLSAASMFGRGSLPYPNPSNNGAYIAPIFMHDTLGVRGRMAGTYDIMHIKPFAHLDTFDGTGIYSGKSFMAVNVRVGTIFGQIAVETSNTWS